MATVNAVNSRSKGGGGLRGVLRYIAQDKKALMENGRRLVSGVNCCADTAYTEFMTTKQSWNKTDGRQFYHFTQSFPPDENVTPEQVHQIGLELAGRRFPGYEVVVATHIDAKHLHSHLIVNSVSFETGKKLHQSREDLMQHRRESDGICRALGLTVLPPEPAQSPVKGVQHREYRAAERGQSWKFALMGTIDRCMDSSHTQAEFVAHMRSFGYGVNFNDGPQKRKTITYSTPKGYKCRDNRLHETKYLKENMLHEFRLRESQIRQYALAGTKYSPVRIPVDEAVSATDLRNSPGAMGRDRGDFAVHGTAVQADPRCTEAVVARQAVPEFHGRAARHTGGADRSAISADGSDRGQNLIPGGEHRQAVGADVPTGWEASRQRLLEMRRADRFPRQEIALADQESVPVHDAGGSVAADILRLAQDVSKIGDYEDDLDNILALSALTGLTVAGACKLIEMLQGHEEAGITGQTVEEMTEELSQQHENVEGEQIWNAEDQEQQQLTL